MNDTLVGALMIAIGLGLVTGGVAVLNRNPARPVQIEEQARLVSDGAAVPGRKASKPPTEIVSSEEKGRAFVEWVVRKFDPRYFIVKDWGGDMHTAGIYSYIATSSQ